MEWLTSPPEGLLSAREWSMSFRNDELLRLLTEFYDRVAEDLFFTTVSFEFGGTASLNWYLTEADRIGCSKAMTELLDWWDPPPPAPGP